jgi:trimeric autotransporter adhesin
MKNVATILIVCLCIIVCMGFTGCGGSSKTPSPQTATVTLITVSAPSSLLPVGETLQLTATATYSDNSTKDVTASATWQSSDLTVATVSSTGLLTAVKAGSTTVTATRGTISGFKSITVTAAALSSIVVTPSNASIATGQTQQFTAHGFFVDGSESDITKSVTWDSDNHAVATVSTAGSAAGMASAISAGTANISATSGTVIATAPLTVTPAALQSIAIYPDGQSVPVGGQVPYTVFGTFSNGNTQLMTNATYSSSDPTIAKIDPVTGVATGVAANVNPVTITATVAGGFTDTTTLTVLPATLQSIGITPLTATLATGTTGQFVLTGVFSDGSTEVLTQGVSWTSSAPAIATIDVNGLASALTPGQVTIGASYNGLSASAATLTVEPAPPTSIVVAPGAAAIGIGGTQQFTATAVFGDGTSQDLTSQVQWSSSAANIAWISNKGLASGVSTGTAQITAAYLGVSGSATLTVSTVTLTSIAVSPANPVVPTRAKIQFTAMGVFSDSSTSPLSGVIWHTNLPRFAVISGSGLARTKRAGTVTISATLNGLTGNTIMTVTSSPLVSVTITPVNPTIAPGTTQQFALTGTFGDSTTVDLSKSAYWQTSNFHDAVISNSGLATAIAAGSVTITATFTTPTQTLSDSTTLTVSSASIVSVSVAPAAPSIALGSAQEFTATGTFTDSTSQDITSVSQWTSSDLAVAVINKTGLATSAGQGTSNITATFKTITGTAVLTVN